MNEVTQAAELAANTHKNVDTSALTKRAPALVTKETWFEAQSRQGDVFLIRIGDVGVCGFRGAEIMPENGRVILADGLSSHSLAAGDAQVFTAGYLLPDTAAHVRVAVGEAVMPCLDRTDNQLVRIHNTTSLDHSHHHGSIPLCPGDYLQPWQREANGRKVSD